MAIRLVIDESTPEEQHYTVPETAELLRVSASTVRNLINDREIGAVDVAREGAERRQLRIPVSEIRRYRASRYLAPAGQAAAS